jgi:hypothetical protein
MGMMERKSRKNNTECIELVAARISGAATSCLNGYEGNYICLIGCLPAFPATEVFVKGVFTIARLQIG